MAITITKKLNKYNLATGFNIFSAQTDNNNATILNNVEIQHRGEFIPTGLILFDQERYGYQFKQIPNTSLTSHFDLSRSLSNILTFTPDLETTDYINIAKYEAVNLYSASAELTGSAISEFSEDNFDNQFAVVFNGRKDIHNYDWDFNFYLPRFQYSFTNTSNFGKTKDHYPLTDRSIEKPIKVNPDEFYTLTFINNFRGRSTTLSGQTLAMLGGLHSFEFKYYDSDYNELSSLTHKLYNSVSFGGGPSVIPVNDNITTIMAGACDVQLDVVQADASVNTNPVNKFYTLFFDAQPAAYHAITIQVLNPITKNIINTNPNVKYVKIKPINIIRGEWTAVYSPFLGLDNEDEINYPETQLWFDVKQDNCNKFDRHQFSWVNSLGFRDYYTFQGKHEKVFNKTGDTYTRPIGNWGGATFTDYVDKRTDKVFNGTYDELFITSSDWLTDEDMEYLNNLLISPYVSVKFAGSNEFTPITITDKQWTSKNFRNDKLFQLTINYKKAYTNKIQNG